MSRPKPVVLAICDGWGVAPEAEGNAISQARTPNYDRFIREYPAMTLYASGNEVGLSFGEVGNSEVGHLNIGGGRVYYQTLPRINKHIVDQSFFKNEAFLQAAAHVRKNKSTFHIIGLLSPGNVHASQEHCYALLEFAQKQRIKNVSLHVILDGRDTRYDSGREFVERLQEKIKEYKRGKIATISGRYYAMDRDHRWDRIEKAYRAMAEGVADTYDIDPIQAIDSSYKQGIYDEEFIPVVIGKKGEKGQKVGVGDAVIFYNFRADRARELTQAFVLPSFAKFDRATIKDLFFVTMTEYEKEIPVNVAFSPVVVHHCLAEVISNAGLKQLHIAETEKYAHVTYFLNGTIEDPFPGEDRIIIPSPRVASYDETPEMSAGEVTKEVIKAIEAQNHDVIFLNFANADMVGHTGNLEAGKKGVETVDKQLGVISDHVLAKGGVLLITSDHGNAEQMINLETKKMNKEHSNNHVPFLIVGREYQGKAGPGGDPPNGDLSLIHPVGVLGDIAPTMLKILGLEEPDEMTGRALI